ncbi:MAG: AmmeMemoRadiSam system protein B [Candidatus Nezhaarchaeota archaeon]|nr:AmmeMemoRadiSam system protein B [Candidatus Nezhaarchaeota archaeon]
MRRIRRPAVAGYFYESDPSSLRARIEQCFLSKLGPGRLPKVAVDGPRRIKGLVVPHAGYMYSGPVAAHAYLALAEDGVPDTVVIIGPNHTGWGAGVSMMAEGSWRTPLGDVEIDAELAKSIQKASELISIDEEAHLNEHSIEVQLPFLAYLYGSRFKFVPICMMLQSYEPCVDVGRAVASASQGRNVVIIASSDFTHYESQASAGAKDRLAIGFIERLDPAGLLEVVESRGISMCGPGPVAAMLVASTLLGASSAKLLKYATSGDVTHDYSSVVGYSSMLIA